MRTPNFKQQAGLTLVEMMIAMVVGLILTSAIVGVFITGSRSYTQDERTAGLQDELRFALAVITRDLEMAGFWGELLNSNSPPLTLDTTLVVGTDCGDGTANWAYTVRDGVSGLDNVTGAEAEAGFSCIDSGDVLANTDIISIKRTSGSCLDAAPSGSVTTLRSSRSAGVLYSGSAPASTTVAAPAYVAGYDCDNTRDPDGDSASGVDPDGSTDDITVREWAYRPAIYYIRNFSVTAGDGIPTLVRAVFQGQSYVTEPLAEGIENLQVEYGVDTNADGIADSYETADGVGSFGNVSSVRIWLLGRSAQGDRAYNNEKTYVMSNAANYAPNDNFYRKVVSTVVVVRNPTALRVQLGE